MVIHLRMPAKGLERTIQLVAKGIINIVSAIERSAMVGEETAWEAMMEGTLDAIAGRLARDPEGIHKAFQLGDELANRVRTLQLKASLPG